MPLRTFSTIDELRPLLGTEVAQGDWLQITQERIDQFAHATGDFQWIHLDAERAARETSFGGTIAHGFLTLSLIPHLIESAIAMQDQKMAVNYGLNKVRFTAPVRCGKRVRAAVTPLSIDEIQGGQQITWKFTVEIEGEDKPACVAEMITRRFV